jgi:energy-coupling factor transporter ATP-binding protein EcfA2
MPEIDPRLRFILVTGNVGAGKSTLAKTLERRLPGWTRVDADYFANQIDTRLVAEWRARGERRMPSWRDSRIPGYALALRQVRDLSSGDSPVLLEACINQAKEAQSFRIAARAEGVGQSCTIQLKCSLDTALGRRIGAWNVPVGWGPPHSQTRFMRLYEAYNNPLNTFSLDLPGSVVICTDGITPKDVLDRALTALPRRPAEGTESDQKEPP